MFKKIICLLVFCMPFVNGISQNKEAFTAQSKWPVDSLIKLKYHQFFDVNYQLKYPKVIAYRNIEDSIPEGIQRRKYYDVRSLLEAYLGNYFETLDLVDRKFEQPTEMVTFNDDGSLTKSIQYPDKIVHHFPDSLLRARYTRAPFGAFLNTIPSNNKVLSLNEAHTAPIFRSTLYNMLPMLVTRGYTHLALETMFQEKQNQFNSSAAPLRSSGYFNTETTMGDVVRKAKQLGFIIIGYDVQGTGSQLEREEQSFQKILERTKVHEGTSKIILYAGHSHIAENSTGGIKNLGKRFKEIGIDPITINQNGYYEKSGDISISEAMLLRPKNVTPNMPFDYRLLLPVSTVVNGRPSWIWSMNRIPVSINHEKLSGLTLPYMVEAYLQNERDTSVPLDRVEVTSFENTLYMALRRGRYRIVATDGYNKQIEYEITVRDK